MNTDTLHTLTLLSIAANFITNYTEISFDLTILILYTLGVYISSWFHTLPCQECLAHSNYSWGCFLCAQPQQEAITDPHFITHYY